MAKIRLFMCDRVTDDIINMEVELPADIVDILRGRGSIDDYNTAYATATLKGNQILRERYHVKDDWFLDNWD